jgi:predicted metal-dependent hydrolase
LVLFFKKEHASIAAMLSPTPESLPLDGAIAQIVWRRSARARRITLRIDARRGDVVVTLPARGKRAAGLRLLGQHAAWIARQLAALPSEVRLIEGGDVMIDGVAHAIMRSAARPGGAWLEKGRLLVAGEPAFLARRVADFLRKEARRRLARQAMAKAEAAGLTLRGVVVRDTTTRWGSCSARGRMMFSWRLVMAPGFVQDYVVAHEVAHLRHLDHGAAFWALADALSPHRRDAVAWLAAEGPRLLRVG